MIRRLVRLALVAVALVVAYLAVTFVQVWQASRRDEARPVSAIVVLGAAQFDGRPSAVLRARLDHAASLYERGFANTVVVTGGRQPGDRFTEASVSAEYLVRRGVPDSAVLREVRGRSSWESLAASAQFLRGRGVRTVLLVSDGFHAARIKSMAGELGLDAWTSPTPTSPIRGAAELPYLVKETAQVAAGRVLGYRRVSGINQRLEERAAGVVVAAGRPGFGPAAFGSAAFGWAAFGSAAFGPAAFGPAAFGPAAFGS